MTDSYHPEDRSIDHEPEFDDWSIRGEKEERERQEKDDIIAYHNEEVEMAEHDADYKQYQANESTVKEEIKELNTLKEKLMPLLKEIKEKEQLLIEESYDWIWQEQEEDGTYEEPYHSCESKEEKKAVDLERNYHYEVITPWINQYTPIAEEMEIQRKKEENLKQHKKKLGVKEESLW